VNTIDWDGNFCNPGPANRLASGLSDDQDIPLARGHRAVAILLIAWFLFVRPAPGRRPGPRRRAFARRRDQVHVPP